MYGKCDSSYGYNIENLDMWKDFNPPYSGKIHLECENCKIYVLDLDRIVGYENQ